MSISCHHLFLIRNLRDTFQINYSELSRKYGAPEKSKVGNMVVKEFLQTKGVDVAKFTGPRKNAQPVTRRRLNRMFGSEITTPVPRTNAATRETLRAKIRTGEYHLGEIIAPKNATATAGAAVCCPVSGHFSLTLQYLSFVSHKSSEIWPRENLFSP